MKICRQCKENKEITNFCKNQSRCKYCHKLWMRYYRRTLRGFLDQKYTAMSKRVRGKDDRCAKSSKGLPIVSRKEFIEWAYQQPELPVMFEIYRKSKWDFKVCSTIDRIDYTDGYVFNNMRFLTQSENSHRNKGRPKNWRDGILI